MEFVNVTEPVIGNYTYAGLSFAQQGGVLGACYVLCVLLVLFWVQILFRFYDSQSEAFCCNPDNCCWLTVHYAYLKIYTNCCCCCGPRMMRRLQRRVDKMKEKIQEDLETMQDFDDSESDEVIEKDFRIL